MRWELSLICLLLSGCTTMKKIGTSIAKGLENAVDSLIERGEEELDEELLEQEYRSTLKEAMRTAQKVQDPQQVNEATLQEWIQLVQVCAPSRKLRGDVTSLWTSLNHLVNFAPADLPGGTEEAGKTLQETWGDFELVPPTASGQRWTLAERSG